MSKEPKFLKESEMKFKKEVVAAFDVDAEKCFTPLCPQELPVIGGHLIAEELNAQAKYAKFRVGSKDAHSPQALWVTDDPKKIATLIPDNTELNVDLFWTLHGVPGTLGFQLLDGLPQPDQYDYFVWKGVELNLHPYGACYHDLANKLSTGAIEFLQSRGVEVVIVGGLAYEFCVGTTILQLLDAKFKVILNEGACRALSDEGKKKMKKILQERGVIIINSAKELAQYI